MPKRKYGATRRRRRRTRNKRRKRYRRALRRSYVPSGLSTTRAAKVRFSTNIQITSPVGAIQSRYFLANNAYNPLDATIGIDSPMGWSLWQSMYKQYCVLGSQIMVIPSQQDFSASQGSYCGVYLSERNTPLYTDRAQYIEAQNTKIRGTWRNLTGQRNQTRALKAKYSAKKWWNFTNVKDADDQWASTVSGPELLKTTYFVVWSQPTQAVPTVTTDFQIIMDFIVLFREPVNIS